MGTIFQNVANGLLDSQKTLSREEQMKLIQQACETSNAHEFISHLPDVGIANNGAKLVLTSILGL